MRSKSFPEVGIASVSMAAVVTSSRADYGHLYWPLRELARVKATLEEAFVELTQD